MPFFKEFTIHIRTRVTKAIMVFVIILNLTTSSMYPALTNIATGSKKSKNRVILRTLLNNFLLDSKFSYKKVSVSIFKASS